MAGSRGLDNVSNGGSERRVAISGASALAAHCQGSADEAWEIRHAAQGSHCPRCSLNASDSTDMSSQPSAVGGRRCRRRRRSGPGLQRSSLALLLLLAALSAATVAASRCYRACWLHLPALQGSGGRLSGVTLPPAFTCQLVHMLLSAPHTCILVLPRLHACRLPPPPAATTQPLADWRICDEGECLGGARECMSMHPVGLPPLKVSRPAGRAPAARPPRCGCGLPARPTQACSRWTAAARSPRWRAAAPR